MRHAPAATRQQPMPDRRTRPLFLAGLFFAVWALGLQFALPLGSALGSQLAAGARAPVYDLAALLTGRIESGHGHGAGDHSLPVRIDPTAVLAKADTPALPAVASQTPGYFDWITATVTPPPSRHDLHADGFDHSRLSRAPPSMARS